MKLSELQSGSEQPKQRIKLSQLSAAPEGGTISSVPKFENILQKMAKAGMESAGSPLGFEANPNFPFLPRTPMDNPMMQAGLDELGPGVSIPSNMLAGVMAGGKPVAKGVKGVYRNLRNPSKAFGESIGKLESSNPTKRVDFFKVLNDASSDPKASKVLQKSGVLERFGGSKLGEGGAVSENLSNLTLQQSQDLVNMVKDSVRQAVKEGTVKPTEIGIAKMFTELSKAQKSAFKGFDKVARNYGFSKKLGKGLKSAKNTFTRGAIYGAGLGTAGSASYQAIKHLNE